MYHANPMPMASREAYRVLLELINSEGPTWEDDIRWDLVAQSLSAKLPKKRHRNLLVEAAGHQLFSQLTETVTRIFMLDPNNVRNLVTGPYQAYVAAIAAMPQRMVELRAAGGADLCKTIRQMVGERWAARDEYPPWELVNARRTDALGRMY